MVEFLETAEDFANALPDESPVGISADLADVAGGGEPAAVGVGPAVGPSATPALMPGLIEVVGANVRLAVAESHGDVDAGDPGGDVLAIVGLGFGESAIQHRRFLSED